MIDFPLVVLATDPTETTLYLSPLATSVSTATIERGSLDHRGIVIGWRAADKDLLRTSSNNSLPASTGTGTGTGTRTGSASGTGIPGGTSSSQTREGDEAKGGLSSGAIAGIIVGIVAISAFVVFAWVVFVWRKRRAEGTGMGLGLGVGSKVEMMERDNKEDGYSSNKNDDNVPFGGKGSGMGGGVNNGVVVVGELPSPMPSPLPVPVGYGADLKHVQQSADRGVVKPIVVGVGVADYGHRSVDESGGGGAGGYYAELPGGGYGGGPEGLYEMPAR